ncbi:hypothetical protein HSBAA_48860 [Vreelandella sulfidaeris]|uniref:TonB-dependent receptor-like beta-barrel domain-containing protein n=1 Tax=Vreelandella sulfidaeris TaxID=115553 RepID=A0A455UBI1_9GAMM|nr:hypothetical protein HSBAA_48860 [Halomonas sulfidaeris]
MGERLGLQLYGRTSQRDEDNILNGYEDKSLQSLTARLSLAASDNHDFTAEAGVTEQDRTSLMGRSAASEGCRGGCSDSYNDYTNQHVALTHNGRFAWGTSETFVQRERSENDSRDIDITNTTAKTSAVVPLVDTC